MISQGDGKFAERLGAGRCPKCNVAYQTEERKCSACGLVVTDHQGSRSEEPDSTSLAGSLR